MRKKNFRELFGAGTLYGMPIIPDKLYDLGYMNNNLMILPPSALIVVGLIIWAHRSYNKEIIEEN